MSLKELRRRLEEVLEAKSRHVWGNRLLGPQIEEWLGNFSGDILREEEEELLALYIAAKFVYISQEELEHLCTVVFRRFLRSRLPELNRGRNEPLSKTRERLLQDTRFHGLGRPSESGDHILYHFRQANALPKNLFYDPVGDSESEPFSDLCILDDVTLTGTQASRYMKETDHIPCQNRSFAFLIGTTQAKKKLQAEGATVHLGIELTDDETGLQENSPVMTDLESDLAGLFTPDDVRSFCRHYGAKVWPSHPLGYGGMGLLLSFNYNVPDNTLPIIWGDQRWTPLLPRDHKKEGSVPEPQGKYI